LTAASASVGDREVTLGFVSIRAARVRLT